MIKQSRFELTMSTKHKREAAIVASFIAIVNHRRRHKNQWVPVTFWSDLIQKDPITMSISSKLNGNKLRSILERTHTTGRELDQSDDDIKKFGGIISHIEETKRRVKLTNNKTELIYFLYITTNDVDDNGVQKVPNSKELSTQLFQKQFDKYRKLVTDKRRRLNDLESINTNLLLEERNTSIPRTVTPTHEEELRSTDETRESTEERRESTEERRDESSTEERRDIDNGILQSNTDLLELFQSIIKPECLSSDIFIVSANSIRNKLMVFGKTLANKKQENHHENL